MVTAHQEEATFPGCLNVIVGNEEHVDLMQKPCWSHRRGVTCVPRFDPDNTRLPTYIQYTIYKCIYVCVYIMTRRTYIYRCHYASCHHSMLSKYILSIKEDVDISKLNIH